MKYHYHALGLIRARLETVHSNLPQSKELAAKLDGLLPILKVHESPSNYMDARAKSDSYQTALTLYTKADAFLDELRHGEENSVSQAVKQVLRGVVLDVENYLERHRESA